MSQGPSCTLAYVEWRLYDSLSKRERKAAASKAEEQLRELIEDEPDNAEAHALLGSVYGKRITGARSGIRLGPKASKSHDRASALDPDNPRIALQRGVSAFFTPKEFGGGLDKAEAELRRAVELNWSRQLDRAGAGTSKPFVRRGRLAKRRSGAGEGMMVGWWSPLRLVLVVGFVVAVASATTIAGKQPVVEGGKLEFQLTDLSGETVGSEDPRFEGKVLLVDLWATWCPPCLTEIPTLNELHDEYADQGLVVVAIAFEAEETGDERRVRLREFVAERGINYLVLDGGRPEDFETALPAVRQVRGFPVEIVVDRTGVVVDARNSYGYKKKWARKLKVEIEGLLGSAVD